MVSEHLRSMIAIDSFSSMGKETESVQELIKQRGRKIQEQIAQLKARFDALPPYRSGLKISASSSSPSKEISKPLGSISLWVIRDEIRERIRGFRNNNVVGNFLADSGNFQIEKEASIEDEAVIEEEELACEDAGASARAPWQGCEGETDNDSGKVRGYSPLVSSLVCDEVAAEEEVERLKMICMGQIWKSDCLGWAWKNDRLGLIEKSKSSPSVNPAQQHSSKELIAPIQFLPSAQSLFAHSLADMELQQQRCKRHFSVSQRCVLQRLLLIGRLGVRVPILWLWKRRKKYPIAVLYHLEFGMKFSSWVFHKFKDKCCSE